VDTSTTWLERLVDTPGCADWRRLLEVYGPLLHGWLSRAGVQDCDRDDIVQDVLVVVVRRLSEFEHRGPGTFRAWLRGILANNIRKYCRTRDVSPVLDLDQLALEDSALGKLWNQDHDGYLVARALKAAEVDFAPNTWTAFCRQVFDECKPSEVAAELGMTLNAVLLAKSRVLKRLREELRGVVE
jgi:RNA polymerase sigma-70 factor, ECF subfamily